MGKYRKSATSGSHAHHGERTGSGPVAGAGVVVSGNPGRAAMRVKPKQPAMPQAAASGKGKIPTYKAGS